IRTAPPRGPVPSGGPLRGRDDQQTPAPRLVTGPAPRRGPSPGNPTTAGDHHPPWLMGSSLRTPDRGPSPEGPPDRSKLFGSHGQRPWLHEVVIPGGLEPPISPTSKGCLRH